MWCGLSSVDYIRLSNRLLLDKGVGLLIYFSGADRLLGDLGREGVVTADSEDLGMATEIT